MRLLLKGLLAISLLAPLASPLSSRPAFAQSSASPCNFVLAMADLPAELRPAPDEVQSSNDPTVCERFYRAQRVGPSGLSAVRSMTLWSPSVMQARIDYGDYRGMLARSGWEEIAPQPVGDEGTVFIGNDYAARVYSVQQLFHRGNYVAVIEATGPALAETPDVVLNFARAVDYRLWQSASGWPAVSTPSIVADVQLTASELAGQGLRLGGFSGLASLDSAGTRFVAVTDRGPTSFLDSGSNQVLVMPLPAFTPSIVKLQIRNGQLEATERLGLHLPAGNTDARTGTSFVTGLPRSEADSPAFDGSGQHRWGTDPYGLDPGGIAVDPRDGSYWICEANGPSILHVDADGTIQLRLVPSGVDASTSGLETRASLPAELAKRQLNRGFRGIAISPDGRRLFATMEGPLANPDDRAARASRSVRLIALDLSGAEPRLDGIYVYLTEVAEQVGAGQQDKIKIGDLASLSPSRLLVTERDSAEGGGYKAIFRVDLDGASNLLGQTTSGRSLEQLDEGGLASAGIRAVTKSGVVNLAQLGWALADFTGLALIDESTIAVVDDNNFGFAGYDSAGHLQLNDVPTRLTIVRLPAPLR